MFGSLIRFAGFGFLLLGLVSVGWDEPLSYRFKTPEQIAAEEAARFPKPKRQTVHDWLPGGSSLDRGPYIRDTNGGVRYVDQGDRRTVSPSSAFRR